MTALWIFVGLLITGAAIATAIAWRLDWLDERDRRHTAHITHLERSLGYRDGQIAADEHILPRADNSYHVLVHNGRFYHEYDDGRRVLIATARPDAYIRNALLAERRRQRQEHA